MKKGDFPVRYVSLPEGSTKKTPKKTPPFRCVPASQALHLLLLEGIGHRRGLLGGDLKPSRRQAHDEHQNLLADVDAIAHHHLAGPNGPIWPKSAEIHGQIPCKNGGIFAKNGGNVQKTWQNGAPLEEILRYGGKTPERGQFRMFFFLWFWNWGAGPCSDLRSFSQETIDFDLATGHMFPKLGI